MLLPFLHPVLTQITCEPTNESLQMLQQELHANIRAIHSTRTGGGENGHIALVTMPADLYLAQTGPAFVSPIHPGDHPIHLPGATQAHITDTNCHYAAKNDLLVKHSTRYFIVGQEVNNKKQLLIAVERKYLCILADANF